VTHFKAVLKNLPQLLSLSVAGIIDREVSALRNDLLSGKGSLGVSPSRVGPPCLDSLDFFLEELVFDVRANSRVCHIL